MWSILFKKFGLMCAAVAVAVTGCVSMPGSLTSSAENLERSAYAFYDDARDERSGRDLERDAEEFARAARDFRRTVEDRRDSNAYVRDAYLDLSKRYHALRDEVEEERSSRAEYDFERVTNAYLDVEREMRNRERDRYASDR